MPDMPTSNPKQFLQGAPVLHVRDVKATAAYYRDVLGFPGTSVTRATRWCGGTTQRFIS
jgi:catechol-2,3-dioxygenase